MRQVRLKMMNGEDIPACVKGVDQEARGYASMREIRDQEKNLALTKPYTIAYKTIAEVENVFLLITLENGVVGVGSSNPDLEVVGESPSDVLNISLILVTLTSGEKT